MKSQMIRAIAGVLLCAGGFWLAFSTRYRERTYIINANGCRLETTIVEKPGVAPQGSVVLFHGLSANKKIMSYMARDFAEQSLRVYVPDLPGHGRTPGPFSPARAELWTWLGRCLQLSSPASPGWIPESPRPAFHREICHTD